MEYSTKENVNAHGKNVNKWIALGMMQRVEQVRDIAEILSATMDDLSDQMTDLESELECLTDATETIQEKIEEMMDLIQDEINPGPDIVDVAKNTARKSLPLL